jgi:hypothetical protein
MTVTSGTGLLCAWHSNVPKGYFLFTRPLPAAPLLATEAFHLSLQGLLRGQGWSGQGKGPS